MIRILGWDDLRARGEHRSKSQIRRAIKARQFPPPAGYNGKSPFWLEEQWDDHVESLISQHSAKKEADNGSAS